MTLFKPRIFGNFQNIRDLFIHGVGKKALFGLERAIARYSLIETTPFLDSNYFSWSKDLENKWQAIAKELKLILEATDKIPREQAFPRNIWRATKLAVNF